MQYLKTETRQACAALMLVFALGLSACGGSSSSSTPTVTISGKITNAISTAAESGVTVRATYDNGNPPVSTTTAADGRYSLTVAQNWRLYLSFSKGGLVTLNSVKGELDANEAGFDIEMVDPATVQMAIDTAAGGAGPALASRGWLAVEIDDANDDPLAGEAITSNPAPSGEWYVNCDGTDSGGNVTVVDANPCDGRLVMYLAYWDSATTVRVSAIGETETVPIIIGEVGYADFMQ